MLFVEKYKERKKTYFPPKKNHSRDTINFSFVTEIKLSEKIQVVFIDYVILSINVFNFNIVKFQITFIRTKTCQIESIYKNM